MVTRRQFSAVIPLLGVGAVVGCANGTGPTNAQLLLDIQGASTTLTVLIGTLVSQGKVPADKQAELMAELAALQAAATAIATATGSTTPGTTVQRAGDAISAILMALGTLALPIGTVQILSWVSALLPAILAFAGMAQPPAVAPATMSVTSPMAARRALGIAVVR